MRFIALLLLFYSLTTFATELFISTDHKSAMIVGPIETSLLEQFEQLPESIETLVIDSTGGRVDIAISISKIIHQRNIETHTKTICYSACTLIYQSGVRRSADPNAHFMYHKVQWFGPGRENLPNFQKMFDQKYLEYGVLKSFVNAITKKERFYFAEDLTKYNIVQEITLRNFEWQIVASDYP